MLEETDFPSIIFLLDISCLAIYEDVQLFFITCSVFSRFGGNVKKNKNFRNHYVLAFLASVGFFVNSHRRQRFRQTFLLQRLAFQISI